MEMHMRDNWEQFIPGPYDCKASPLGPKDYEIVNWLCRNRGTPKAKTAKYARK